MGRLKLGISNLAWDSEIDFKVLQNSGITYLEVVLPKYLDWGILDTTGLRRVIENSKDSNVKIVSTQSIMFGSDVESFCDSKFITHIEKVIALCSTLKISKLVLGAPNMRKGSSSSVDTLRNFHYLDSILGRYNQVLLIEPNSRTYGGMYFYTVGEIVKYIVDNKFTNIRTMVDTHNTLLEGENPTLIYKKYKQYIDHIHISEEGLLDFKKSKIHTQFSRTLKNTNYSGVVTYEVLPTPNLTSAIETFKNTYNI